MTRMPAGSCMNEAWKIVADDPDPAVAEAARAAAALAVRQLRELAEKTEDEDRKGELFPFCCGRKKYRNVDVFRCGLALSQYITIRRLPRSF